NLDPVLENPAAVKELHLERQALASPESAVGPVADAAIGVVVDLGKFGRHGVVGRLVGLLSELPRQPPYSLPVEGLLGWRVAWHVGRTDADAATEYGQRRGGAGNELSAIQRTPSTD